MSITDNSIITIGKGEYIVYHKHEDTYKLLDNKLYNKIYSLLNSNARINNRYQLNKKLIYDIDPTIEILFIPATLYELIYIRKCINEDIKHGDICESLDPKCHQAYYYKDDIYKQIDILNSIITDRQQRKCWHLAHFTDQGDNNHTGVKIVAYRLNNTILKLLLKDYSHGFTLPQYLNFVINEVQFLKDYYNKCTNKNNKNISSCNTPGPTTCFGYESTRGSIKPMAIRNNDDAEIIYNALKLECSVIDSCIIYRGTDILHDLPYSNKDDNKPYSLSYGSSLFAGVLFDGGATAYHYMRDKYAYAIIIPFNEINNCPFYIPNSNTLAQLFGNGEIFHVRSKVWIGVDSKDIAGFNLGRGTSKRDHIKSTMSKDELISKFAQYKNSSVHLK